MVNHLTFTKIEQQKQLELSKLLQQIVPKKLHDNNLAEHCIMLTNKEYLGTDQPLPAYVATRHGQGVAIAMETIAPDGYNGDIKIIIGIDHTNKILGVRTLFQQETPGLGDKIEIRKSNWVTEFTGMKVLSSDDKRWKVKKDGGQFDQFTGATITPRAYVKAVKKAALYFEQNKEKLLSTAANCEVDGE